MESFKRNFVLLVMLIVIGSERTESRRDRNNCTEDRLKFRETAADVILTGTVKRLYGVQEDRLYAAEVQVKRVVKGQHLKAGESLVVEGFGNTNVCDGNVKARDSKIFLLNQLQSGRFKLNSSLLQINVPNLDKVTAAVKGQPYKSRPIIQDVPCEKKFCPFNGDCYMDQLRPQCRCPTTCPQPYNPVCASDGTSYNTECQMRADTCRRQRSRIYVKHEGKCI